MGKLIKGNDNVLTFRSNIYKCVWLNNFKTGRQRTRIWIFAIGPKCSPMILSGEKEMVDIHEQIS